MPIQLSGSLVITGSITTTGVITMSGSIASASYSSNSDLLQGTGSVGFATTASFNAVSSSQQQISSSYIALSASYNVFSGSTSTRTTQIENVYATTGSNSFRANQSITGSLVVSSTITAQTLVVQTVTSSIVYSSGSNNFGNQLSNNQTFTGSVNITGSLALAGNITGNAITLTGALSGTSAVFSSTVDGTIINSTSNAFRFSGNNAISLVSLNSQNVVKINAAGYWGTQLVGANDKGILIDNTGLVGIGVTVPVAELQVGKSSDVTFAMSNSSSVTSGTRGNIVWYNSSNSSVASIKGVAVTDNVGTELQFYTRPAAGSLTQTMTLNSSGNLGLGVTPSDWFVVHKVMQLGGNFSGTAYAGAFTAQTNDNVINLFNNAYVNSSNVETYYATAEAAKYRINRNSHEWYNAPSGTAGAAITFTQQMTLDASGQLGVGVISPNTRLHIKGFSQTNGTVQFEPNATKGAFSSYIHYGTNGDWYIRSASASGFVSINDTGGNVLIGTSTDSGYKLDVNGTGRFSGTITSSTGNNTRLFTSISATTGYQYMDMNNTAGRLVWGINGSTANAIASNSLANGGVLYALNSLQLGVDGDMKLTIASTGAATFASSLYAASTISSGTSIAASTYVSAPSGFYTTSNNNAIPFTTWTTLTTVDSNVMGIYLVVIGLSNQVLTDWAATGILYSSGAYATWIVGPTNGSLVQLRISGTNIQVYQNGGSPSQNLSYKLLKIA